MLGAFLGANLVYLAAEGWMFWDSPQRWVIFATGKTILGALLGGYAAVELAKHLLNYTAVTGGRFAMVVPVGIVLGRIGCLLHGCCPGQVFVNPLGGQCAMTLEIRVGPACRSKSFSTSLHSSRSGCSAGPHFHLVRLGTVGVLRPSDPTPETTLAGVPNYRLRSLLSAGRLISTSATATEKRLNMTPEQRRKFIRWFCILAPTVGALLAAGFLIFFATGSFIPNWLQNFLGVSPLVGWVVLTIGCSIGLALDLQKSRGRRGAELAIYVTFLTPLIAISHCCVVLAVAYGGCVAMAGGGFLH
ncbi:MAG: prolipoprotein diacylglyceryl transferase family protein [Chthoniobacteraceae bacterium]